MTRKNFWPRLFQRETKKRVSRKRGLSLELLESRQLLSVSPIQAGDGSSYIVVNSEADSSSSSDAYTTLREAISYANSNSSVSNIYFADNVDSVSLTSNQLSVQGSYDIHGDITASGTAREEVTIARSSSTSNAFRIFNVDDGTNAIRNVTFTGLTITNGLRASDGGGLRNNENLKMENCIVENNTVYAAPQTGAITGEGGGILNYGTLNLNDSILRNNTINVTSNTSATSRGGGIMNAGTLIIQDSTLQGNNAGANICVQENEEIPAAATSQNVKSYGGAIYNDSNGTVLISSSTFTTNKIGCTGASNVTKLGGAVYNSANGKLEVETTTFDGNGNALNGGAIATAGDINVVNSTFFQNTALDTGGAIWMAASSVSNIVDSTFYGNQGNVNGGAIANSGTAYVTNSLVIGNKKWDSSANDLYAATGKINLIYSLYGKKSNAAQGNFTEIQSLPNQTSAATFASTTLEADGTMKILEDSNAADSGTLIGKLGTDFYYYDISGTGNLWRCVRQNVTQTYAFDASDTTTYGLKATGKTTVIYKTAQNLNVLGERASRVSSITEFCAGAYAVNQTETPSTVVTTQLDVMDPFDDLISLREAIAYAGGSLGNTVTFSDTINWSVNPIQLESGTLFIDKNLTITSVDSDGDFQFVTIDGQSASRIFTVDDGTTSQIDVTLAGLTLTNGFASASGSSASASGGAVWNAENLQIEQCTLSKNEASVSGTGTISAYGGAVWSSGNLNVKDSVFTENLTTADSAGDALSYGGAIYNNKGTVSLENTIFLENQSSANAQFNVWSAGAGVYNQLGELTVTDCMISENHVSSNSTSGTIIFANGGGILNNDGEIQINRTSFDSNTLGSSNTHAVLLGAALRNYEGSVLIENSTFQNHNTAKQGGAIYNLGEMAISNSTFTSNSTSEEGGAVLNAAGKTLSISNSTIYNNEAEVGAGVANYGVFYGSNLLATGNQTSSGTSDDLFTATDTAWLNYVLYGTVSTNGTASFTENQTIANVTPTQVFTSLTPTTEGLMKIKADSAAARDGTLLGRLGTNLYYYDVKGTSDVWKCVDVTVTQTYAFDASDTVNYGLTESGLTTTIFKTAQNLVGGVPASRVDVLNLFCAGAYATTPEEIPSTIVTTQLDVMDPFDELISLREAIAYAGGDLGNTITFSDTIDWSANPIQLELGALIIDKDLTISSADASGVFQSITIDGQGASRIFTVDDGTTSQIDVTLAGFTLTNGSETVAGNDAAAQGGAVWNAENLVLNSIRLYGNEAIAEGETSGTAEGGAVWNSGTLTIRDSFLVSNEAGASADATGTEIAQGGAIFNANGGTLSLTNSLTAGNRTTSSGAAASETSQGGALFNAGGTVTSVNSTLAGNEAGSGGAIYTESGSTTLYNTIAASNYAQDEIFGNYSGSNNLVTDDSADLFENPLPTNQSDWTDAQWEAWIPEIQTDSDAVNAGIENSVVDEAFFGTQTPDWTNVKDPYGNQRKVDLLDLGVFAATTLAAPTNLTATSVTSSSIGISWTNNSTAATSIVVQYRMASSAAWNSVTLPASAASTTISGLNSDTYYEFRIVAAASGYTSGISDELKVQTTTGAPSIYQEGNNIVISFNIQGETGNSYILKLKADSCCCTKTVPVTTGASGNLTAVFSRYILIPGKEYSYQLLDQNNVSLATGTLTARNLVPPCFCTTADSTTSFLVTPNQTDANTTDYMISYRTFSGGQWTSWTSEATLASLIQAGTVVENSDGTLSVPNLTPGATVQFKVYGAGSWNDTTNTLYLNTPTQMRTVVLKQPQLISAPVVSVKADSTTSATITVKNLSSHASGVTYSYRQFTNSQWGSWTTDVTTSDTSIALAGLTPGATIQVKLFAQTSDAAAWKSSIPITYTCVLKQVQALKTPVYYFNTFLNKVTTFDQDANAATYSVQYKLTTDSAWQTVQKTAAELAAMTNSSWLTLLGGSYTTPYVTLQLKLQAQIGTSDVYKDSIVFGTAFLLKTA